MLTILCRVAYHAPNWTKDCQKIQVWKNWKYLWVYYLPSSTQFFTDRRNKSVTLLRDWTSWLQVPAAFLRWSDWRLLFEFFVITLPTKFLTTQQIKVVTESNNSMREDMQEEIAACLKRNETLKILQFVGFWALQFLVPHFVTTEFSASWGCQLVSFFPSTQFGEVWFSWGSLSLRGTFILSFHSAGSNQKNQTSLISAERVAKFVDDIRGRLSLKSFLLFVSSIPTLSVMLAHLSL